MKILVIGVPTVAKTNRDYAAQLRVLTASMGSLGHAVSAAGHDLVVCSPFPGSADREAVLGAARIRSDLQGPAVDFHCPDEDSVRSELERLKKDLDLTPARIFSHPVTKNKFGRPNWKNTWLLSQLSALDSCHAVVAVGGKSTGTASLLLHFADGQRKAVLPFTFLGGAAAGAYERRRFELNDKLGSNSAALHKSPNEIDVASLLANCIGASATRSGTTPPGYFFVSYARERPHEADFVETLLRRRGCLVFRDDSDFGPGRSLPREVTEYIHRAEVFVALWCREYACSPWCFDELELAVARSQSRKLALWLLCIDNTRIVPPGARSLVNYPVRTREELEGCLITLLTKPKL